MIKAVFLDVDNTLLDFNACANIAMQAVFQQNSLCFEPFMFDVFTKCNDQLWKQIEDGSLTRQELFQIRWNLIFRELGINFDGPAFESQFFKALDSTAEPVDGAADLLQYLRKKYRLFVASNAMHEQQVHRLHLAGMLDAFEEVFTSDLLGCAKPAPAFFEACLQRVGISPAQTMMIGDSLRADIGGAIAAGMKTCWFTPDPMSNKSALHPDQVVTRLSEIQNFL